MSDVEALKQSNYSKTIDRAIQMCTGGNVRLAKYAARLLGQLKQTAACETIIDVRVWHEAHALCGRC
jgi:hypothetical protein